MSKIAPFAPKLVSLIRRTLSVAETGKEKWDCGAVYIYADDSRYNPPRRQVTLSIGFTENGNLKAVVSRYVASGGSSGLATYVSRIGKAPSLCDDSKFIELLKSAGNDPLMCKVQEDCFDEFYMAPAFKWASENGFTQPLSYLVIADSFLHSGSMLPFLMKRFPERKPAAGGNEIKWIKAYLDARKNWLASHSNRVLRSTVYRANCFLAQLVKENWNLAQGPIVMNGTPVKVA